MSNATPGLASSTPPGTANSLPAKAAFARLLASVRERPLPALLIAGAASVAIVAAMLMWAQTPEYRVLYSNFSEADGGRIIAELDKRGVPYRFGANGQTLLVPADKMHSLRLQLAEQGLPQSGNVGFELLDKQAFGVSQFAEHINFQRGLEGELARTIESLGPVAKARVHLALPKQSIFIRDRQPSSASVVLTLHAGRQLGPGQVDAIVHMVSSSVPNLAIESVTVVDQNGRLLSSRSQAGRSGLDETQISYVEELESSYQRRIERILAPIVGAENLRAQVAVEVDFANREETAERYTPNQKPGEAAVRSQQSSENYNGSDDPARGIPGALSNTPPSAPAAPGAPKPGQPNAAQGAAQQTGTTSAAAASGSGARNSVRRDNMTNYEVDRSVEHVQQQRGSIKRLTAAVVVNYRTTVDAEGKPKREALTQEELASIDRLVRQAVGFSANRGDELEVANSPFTEASASVEETAWWQSPEFFNLATAIARYLMVALAALLLWLVLLRPLQRRHAAQLKATEALRVEAEEAAKATAAATGTASGGDNGESGAPLSAGELQSRLRRRSAIYEHNLANLREMAKEDPRMIAMIIRGWLKKNE